MSNPHLCLIHWKLLLSLTHSMKVWFQIGFRVCFFISVWQIFSCDTVSFATYLHGLAFGLLVLFFFSSSSTISRQYGSLKPDKNTQEMIEDPV